MTAVQIAFIKAQRKRAARAANEAMRDRLYLKNQDVIVWSFPARFRGLLLLVFFTFTHEPQVTDQ